MAAGDQHSTEMAVYKIEELGMSSGTLYIYTSTIWNKLWKNLSQKIHAGGDDKQWIEFAPA